MPEVVLHNSVSLDGSLTNFVVDMGLHYRVAACFKPQIFLIGSKTLKVGVEMFSQKVPLEESCDFLKPNRSNSLPYWVVIDTTGSLRNFLHVCRRFEYCRDIVLLICENTPLEYVDFLKQRKYDFHVVGKNHVDLDRALELLGLHYGVKRVLTDTGQILGNLLLNQGLVSQVSLLVHPFMVGSKAYPMFYNVRSNLKLYLVKSEVLEKGIVWLLYNMKRDG